jgi:dinuclear metal center YbgI/SA1388 family protein
MLNISLPLTYTYTSRKDLLNACESLLKAERFKDYCPNGLQVEGKRLISKLALAVTANQASIDAAIEWGADALLVHHGLMWKGESGVVTQFRKQRLQAALNADLNIIAYHLPLDAHPVFGNNIQLAHQMTVLSECVPIPNTEDIVWQGVLTTPISALDLSNHVSSVLNRPATLIVAQNDEAKLIHRLGWCTGGGASYFEQAIDAGVDAFLTGEADEQHVHIAREMNIPLILGGHHATERYGVQALGAQLAEQLNLNVRFFDIDSPL